MDCVRVAVVCFILGIVLAKSPYKGREQRLFRYGYSYTKTVVRPFTITTLVPSSCVHVEATLPPCRNVRFLGNFPGFGSSSSDEAAKSAPANSTTVADDEIQTTALSWGEYLGFSAPTVTLNVTKITTSTILNPSVIVTFSIRGCRPQRMPLELERCKIQATPTTLPIVPTSTVNVNSAIDNTNQITSDTADGQIQGSQADIQSANSNNPTTSLNT
ncbi:alpha/beta hydrolase domain-containing protein [Holotrichia oblita]|uniref:Alpha/beta hydrolase domain-containing protein n=2 Tax=Holotrichia oblita TaxID=644536 RepID=A0ACB9TU29_HOLOL|nr:alpha/beta hydrolase domain-containing protein [Holotrichia oblita]KAI4470310.1 alpha/beta hydrolase domain-containing protein [Holotrichia oblita]